MQKHIKVHGLDFFVCMEQTYRDQGYYIAIPNWGVCVEAAGPQGWEYNAEKLRDCHVAEVASCAEEIAKTIAREDARETGRIVVMSTAHLQESTFRALDGTQWPISFVNCDGYGTILRLTSDDYQEDAYPEDLIDCIEFAKNSGCDYIRFERDGAEYKSLQKYQW